MSWNKRNGDKARRAERSRQLKYKKHLKAIKWKAPQREARKTGKGFEYDLQDRSLRDYVGTWRVPEL